MEIKSSVSNCPKKREKTFVDRLLKRGILNKSLSKKPMGAHTGKLSIYYCLLFLCYQCKLLRNGQPVKHKAGLQQKASMTDVTT